MLNECIIMHNDTIPKCSFMFAAGGWSIDPYYIDIVGSIDVFDGVS